MGVDMSTWGILAPVLVILFSTGSVFLVRLFQKPVVGLYAALIYSFVMPMLGREILPLPFGVGFEILLIITWVVVFIRSRQFDWKLLNNDLVVLTTLWFLLSVLEVINPAGASVMGWATELRSVALHPLLIIPLTLLLCNSRKSIDVFVTITVAVSVFAALYGVRQLEIGLTPGETAFVEESADTHLLWGQLRVFSFFTDAGQFGASQAHVALIAGLLVLGPFKWWVRLLCASSAIIVLIGMLISGTRGALFVLIVGAFVALFLFKNFRVFALGLVVLAMGVAFLKYTDIGASNYQIERLRTALDPEDASLNVRFINQRILRDYLKDKPFGGGLGVIGDAGHEYNSDKFLSTIEPDSYWVKVWAMYGIVGFVLWFAMQLYLLGKCCGIVWHTRDPKLRVILIALTAGVFGIFAASYGNEVMNRVPSSILIYMSMAVVYLSSKLDRKVDSPAVEAKKTEAYAI